MINENALAGGARTNRAGPGPALARSIDARRPFCICVSPGSPRRQDWGTHGLSPWNLVAASSRGVGAEEGLRSTYESFIVALDNGDYFISGDASLARKRVHATRHAGPDFLDGSSCQVCALADRNLFLAAVA